MTIGKQTIALAVSVFLNLFLCGIIAGQWMQRGGFAEPGQQPPGIQRDDLDRILPDEKLQQLQKIMGRQFGPRGGDGKVDMRKLNDELSRIISAQNFDIEKFRAKSEEIRTAQKTVFGEMNEELGNFLAGLTPEQRQQLAQHFTRALSPVPPRRGNGPDGMGPGPRRGGPQEEGRANRREGPPPENGPGERWRNNAPPPPEQ